MKKVLLRLFIVFCLSTSILLVAPFHIAYAEGDIIPASQFNTNNIIGSQITYNTEYYETTGQYDQYDNTIEFILDDYYIGKIDSLTVTYRYIGNSTDRTISFTNVGVNGTSFTVTIANTGDRVSTANLRITTLRYDGQFYTKSSFLQVFPFESFAIQSFNLCNNQLVGINNQYQYQFNMFKLIGTTSSQYVTASKMHQFYGYAGTQYTWIFWIDKNVYDNTTFFQYVTLGNNLAFVDIKVIDRFHFEGHTTSIVNVTLQGINNAGNTPSYRGDTDALFYLGLYYENGFVVEKNIQKAVALYQNGAEHGDAYCCSNLGKLYADGFKGQKPDYKKAAGYYLDALVLGDALGYAGIGHMYEVGTIAGKEDIETAKKWYQLAAKHDFEPAIEELKRLGDEFEPQLDIVEKVLRAKCLLEIKDLSFEDLRAAVKDMNTKR